jgi:hypothetical protein
MEKDSKELIHISRTVAGRFVDISTWPTPDGALAFRPFFCNRTYLIISVIR